MAATGIISPPWTGSPGGGGGDVTDEELQAAIDSIRINFDGGNADDAGVSVGENFDANNSDDS